MAQRHNPVPSPTQPARAREPLPELDETLRRAGAVLSEERALEASRLLDRWQSRSFLALILGEFKCGKSPLLNALIGQDLLPGRGMRRRPPRTRGRRKP